MDNQQNESDMFPKILSLRVYNSRNYITEKTVKRKAENFEIGIYLENSGTIIINEIFHKIKRGSVRFIKPGSVVYSIPHYTSISLIIKFGEDGMGYDKDIIDEIPEFFQADESFITKFIDIVTLYSLNEKCSKLKVNSLLCSLLYDLYFVPKKDIALSLSVKKCTDYIKEHYNEQITLNTLGEITGYVPLHVLRLFKQQTGKTPHDFLINTRMTHARTLLDSTTLSISEISLMCGFNSPSHFQSLFKKIYNISPGKYRKKTDVYEDIAT